MQTILIIEDNELNWDILSRLLQREGFATIIATDGQQGIDMARATLPDVIIMDLGLPVLDGLAATRAIKADAATRHIPVIALTAHAMSEDHYMALAAGCDDFDTKPIELKRLLAKIQQQLHARHPS